MNWVEQFLQQHRLPQDYAGNIDRYFREIAKGVSELQKQNNKPLLVGINGCQGSGKTTLADALVMLLQEELSLHAIAISIDDFYLTKREREHLGNEVHPLFATRGVPGTHDIALANQTISQLLQGKPEVAVPRFNKAIDDRYPESDWELVEGPVDVVILEGWCVLSPPQPEPALARPVNKLEEGEDAEGDWRRYANQRLATDYRQLYSQCDCTAMLKAPSFGTVYNWRCEQERKLKQRLQHSGEDMSGVMSDMEIERFIQHYQRVTEHTLRELPTTVDWLLELDDQRAITNCVKRT